VLNAVDGCIPSNLGTGSTAEIEEERRLLYVAATRAKDDLHVIVPQRFFVRSESVHGDRHVYATRTRFIPPGLLPLFECKAWPITPNEEAAVHGERRQVRVDVAAGMRGVWRREETTLVLPRFSDQGSGCDSRLARRHDRE